MKFTFARIDGNLVPRNYVLLDLFLNFLVAFWNELANRTFFRKFQRFGEIRVKITDPVELF